MSMAKVLVSLPDELLAELLTESVELSEVDAALARLRAGTYGICEATGAPIDPERLRALPWTRLSLAAAAQRETAKADRIHSSPTKT